MATHSSTLAWKIPRTEEPGRLQSMGLLSQTWLKDLTFTFHFHALEKEMAAHSSVLAWRIPGMAEHCRLQSTGSHRVEHDWSDLAAAAAAASFVYLVFQFNFLILNFPWFLKSCFQKALNHIRFKTWFLHSCLQWSNVSWVYSVCETVIRTYWEVWPLAVFNNPLPWES